MRWFAWAVGQLLGPRQLTMEQIRNGAHIKWGWRGTDIVDDDGKLIAHTPGANKPGHVGPFPVDDLDLSLDDAQDLMDGGEPVEIVAPPESDWLD